MFGLQCLQPTLKHVSFWILLQLETAFASRKKAKESFMGSLKSWIKRHWDSIFLYALENWQIQILSSLPCCYYSGYLHNDTFWIFHENIQWCLILLWMFSILLYSNLMEITLLLRFIEQYIINTCFSYFCFLALIWLIVIWMMNMQIRWIPIMFLMWYGLIFFSLNKSFLKVKNTHRLNIHRLWHMLPFSNLTVLVLFCFLFN